MRLPTVYLIGPITILLSRLCIFIEVLSRAHSKGGMVVVGGRGGGSLSDF